MTDPQFVTLKDFSQFLKLFQTTTNELRTDVSQLRAEMRQQFGQQGMMLKTLQIDVNSIKQSVRRLGILYEDLDDHFSIATELLHDNLNVRDQIYDHETRLTNVESVQTIMKRTVREHSRKLKTT